MSPKYFITDKISQSLFNVHRSVHLKNILIYIQQDATLHHLFYLETALHISTCFGVGTSLSVLQHTQNSSNSSTIAANSSNGVTNTRCCRYSCLRS
jgi:hypothetical protein